MGTVTAVATRQELIEHRKQSIRDWQKVTRALKAVGMPERDSAYQRVQAALRRSQTRLANLEGTFRGVVKDTHTTTSGIVGSILEKLGIYDDSSLEEYEQRELKKYPQNLPRRSPAPSRV